MNTLSEEYVRGLVEGEGSFTFDTRHKISKIPTFVIAMHKRDENLLRLVRETLGISVKMDSHSVYRYKVTRKDGYRE